MRCYVGSPVTVGILPKHVAVFKESKLVVMLDGQRAFCYILRVGSEFVNVVFSLYR
jgi:hypothetical protein